jgi:tRNA dimethylallyltransferase
VIEFPVNLISVDATQIYKDCNIGAAKLTQQELERYPHALVDIISPAESFSVDAFH